MKLTSVFSSRNLSEKWWVWASPGIIVLSVLYLWPLVSVIRYSFTDALLADPSYSYTAGSYRYVFSSSDFWYSMKVTFIFVGGSVAFQLLLGLITALLINKELFGAFFVKLGMISAWAVPGIITGVVWQIIYSESSWGILNYLTRLMGLGKIPFLSSPGWALFSVTLANIWRGTGFSGILQYAGLRSIPEQLYEAAKVDGASGWQQFKYITLPQLRPVLLINVVLITIYTFNTYDLIFSLTKGGPGGTTSVIALQAYKETFRLMDLGAGSVYAVLMFCLSLIFTFIYYQLIGMR